MQPRHESLAYISALLHRTIERACTVGFAMNMQSEVYAIPVQYSLLTLPHADFFMYTPVQCLLKNSAMH